MFSSFRLNTISAAAAAAATDAPAIPSLTWTGGGWITSTFNTDTRYRTTAIVGNRADGWHYVYARGDGASGRLTHNNNLNLSQAAGFTPTGANSTSLFSTTTTRGGNMIGVYSTATQIRATLGTVQTWTTTPTQSTTPTGALATTTITRSGGDVDDVAVAIAGRNANNDTRAAVFWQSAGTLYHAKYVAAPGAATFTSQVSSALSTGATGIYSGMGAVCFTTGDGTGRWMVGGWNGSTGYKVSGGTLTDFATSSAGTTVWNQSSVLSNAGGVISQWCGLAMAWDDYTNSKFVGVAMITDSTNTVQLRAIKWSDGTMGTTVSSAVTGAYQTRISRVNSTSSGFGLVLITYLKTLTGNTIYGRFASVDSTTLAITVGSEFSLGVSGDSLAMSDTPSYAVDCAKNGTNWAFSSIWCAGAASAGDGGGWLSTATG